MDQQRDMRVSDNDRQAAVARLRQALDEGRLELHEFDSRTGQAYQAKTYGDLSALFADLQRPPDPGILATPAPQQPVPHAGAPAPAAHKPGTLRTLWQVWLSITVVSLVTWVVVSTTNGRPDDFWPVWLVIPGAMLAVVSFTLNPSRR